VHVKSGLIKGMAFGERGVIRRELLLKFKYVFLNVTRMTLIVSILTASV